MQVRFCGQLLHLAGPGVEVDVQACMHETRLNRPRKLQPVMRARNVRTCGLRFDPLHPSSCHLGTPPRGVQTGATSEINYCLFMRRLSEQGKTYEYSKLGFREERKRGDILALNDFQNTASRKFNAILALSQH